MTQGYVFWEHVSGADVLTVGQVTPKVWEGIRCLQLTGPWKATFIKLPPTMLQASLPSVGLAIRQQREVDCGKVCVCSWFKKMVGLFLTSKIVSLCLQGPERRSPIVHFLSFTWLKVNNLLQEQEVRRLWERTEYPVWFLSRDPQPSEAKVRFAWNRDQIGYGIVWPSTKWKCRTPCSKMTKNFKTATAGH